MCKHNKLNAVQYSNITMQCTNVTSSMKVCNSSLAEVASCKSISDKRIKNGEIATCVRKLKNNKIMVVMEYCANCYIGNVSSRHYSPLVRAAGLMTILCICFPPFNEKN